MTVASQEELRRLQRLLQHEMPDDWPKNKAGLPKVAVIDRIADTWIRLGWATEDDVLRLKKPQADRPSTPRMTMPRTDKQTHAAMQNLKKASAKALVNNIRAQRSTGAAIGRSDDRRNAPVTLPRVSILEKKEDTE